MFKKIFKYLLYTISGFFVLSVASVVLYRWVNPPVTPLMIIRKIENGAKINYLWMNIDKIPQAAINCAVAAEDNNFLSHSGIDFGAIEKAMDEQEKTGRVRGASTITQQTAKNVFLWQGRTWLRKGFELYFTTLIEIFWSKERIMEIYLNVIEMGDGVYGIEAAAQHYFKKSAAKLSPAQSALIVAAFPAPLKRNPAKPSAYLTRRANTILSLSHKIGNVKFDEKAIEKAKERYEKRHKIKDKRLIKNENTLFQR